MGNILVRLDASSATPSTKAPSLHRNYPASTVLRASPPPRPARIVPRGHPVGGTRASTDRGFPCCVVLLRGHAVATTPAGPRARVVHAGILPSLIFARDGSLLHSTVGSAPALGFSRPARRSLTLRPARSPNHPCDPFIKDSDGFVASTAASIATGWNDPLPGGTDSR